MAAGYFDPDPLTEARLYDGVRTRRSMAFLLDVVFLALLSLAAGMLVFFLGIMTLGLGWMLFALIWPAVPLLYAAFTLGGRNSATPGMRAFGLEMRMLDGSRPNPLIAAAHSVLFWLSVTLLTPFVLLFSLIADRKRLLHDLVLGTVVVNRT